MYMNDGETKDCISNKMIYRLKKEISKYNIDATIIDNKYIYVPVKLYPSLQKNEESMGKDPALVISLKNYPWKAPKVTYFSKEIQEIYGCGGSNEIINEIRIMEGKSRCLGCDSILCSNNWHPANNIKMIIDEFLHVTSLKARARERVICNKMQENFFKIIKTHNKKMFMGCLPLNHYRISNFL